MEVLRVFNNNVVLARDEQGSEVILTGRGLGFQARPGQVVDPGQVTRVFRPDDGRDPDHIAEMLAAIPAEHLQLVSTAMSEAGLQGLTHSSATLLISLADHVSFALRRMGMGMTIDYPLLAEVEHLYAEEYSQASRLLTAVNAHLDEPLPQGEAVALALHLVNAGFASGDLSYTYTMTGIIQQMVAVIEQSFGIHLDLHSINVGRFVTHLRFLFVRIAQHKQLANDHSIVGNAIRSSYPDAVACAERLVGILELRLGSGLTDDEVSYLALHVARVTADAVAAKH